MYLMASVKPLETFSKSSLLVVLADRVAGRIVEHDGVVALHGGDAGIAVIRQFDPFQIGFLGLASRQGVVHKGEG